MCPAGKINWAGQNVRIICNVAGSDSSRAESSSQPLTEPKVPWGSASQLQPSGCCHCPREAMELLLRLIFPKATFYRSWAQSTVMELDYMHWPHSPQKELETESSVALGFVKHLGDLERTEAIAVSLMPPSLPFCLAHSDGDHLGLGWKALHGLR